jgi:hypothetical protein
MRALNIALFLTNILTVAAQFGILGKCSRWQNRGGHQCSNYKPTHENSPLSFRDKKGIRRFGMNGFRTRQSGK